MKIMQQHVQKRKKIIIMQLRQQFQCKKQFNKDGFSQIVCQKVDQLVELLNKPKIQKKKLKTILSQGIPQQAKILREYCWKIILGYLPENKSDWEISIKKQKASYQQFIKLFIPPEKLPDYPYALDKNHEQWQQLHQDFQLWQQIEKDTSRTHSQLTFFSAPAPQILIPFFTGSRKQRYKLINGEDKKQYMAFLSDKQLQKKTYRYDYMSRILFIYAKLNFKIGYVQGMNQILAPIFYIVNASKPLGSPIEEASCFFMFNSAIADIIQLHIKDLDKSQQGIYGTLGQINDMLVVIEPNVWKKLENLQIDPFYYCFRWITLLFAQDFQLFQVLRIWESIFSAENRIKFMNFFAISIIISAKKFILKNKDFTKILTHLQNIGNQLDVNDTIQIAKKLNQEYKYYNFKQDSKQKKEGLKMQQTLRNQAKKNQQKQQKGLRNFIRSWWE